MGDRGPRLFGAGLVGVLTFVSSFHLFDPTRILLGPDAIEHVSIANALVQGHGFVNPIQWYFGWEGPPPIPGPASRPPAVPLLIAAGLVTGADLPGVMVAHIAFGAVVAVGMFLLACRFLRPWLSAIATLLVTLSTRWAGFSGSPLSELTAVGAMLLVIATAPGVARSGRGAIACALATVVAWLVRPNLAPMALAVVVAAGWHARSLAAVLRPPVLAYVGALIVMFTATSWLVTGLTGLPPYHGYRHAFEHFPEARAYRWGTEYIGTLPFVLNHLGAVARACARNAASSFRALFLSPDFWFAGWFLVLGGVSIVRSPRKATIEERVALLSALGFCLIVVLTYPAFDRARYLFLPAVLSILVGMGGVESLLRRWEERRPDSRRPALRRAAWAVISILAIVATRPLHRATAPASPPAPPHELSPLCDELEPGALVMSDEPWGVHWACGNPAVRVPADLRNEPLGADFLATYAPRYFIAYRRPWRRWAARDPRMIALGSTPRTRLFEIEGSASAARAGAPIRPPRCLLPSTARACRETR